MRVRAFGIYELNGQQENHAGEDWLQAKRELRALGEDTVSCVRCTALLRTLRSAQRSYDAALTSTFYVVSKKLAARKQVDMERAKDELFEHQRICRRPSLPLRGSAR